LLYKIFPDKNWRAPATVYSVRIRFLSVGRGPT